ncbi:unnamed protein product [Blumeria hordei]|uniref:Uncharacterized protein n=1 Tax=Blumeria hordei TaxID=2867405 RepID=A0A383UXD0_BLUHO|nr:unnamed protein product [Blumeria hordei]
MAYSTEVGKNGLELLADSSPLYSKTRQGVELYLLAFNATLRGIMGDRAGVAWQTPRRTGNFKFESSTDAGGARINARFLAPVMRLRHGGCRGSLHRHWGPLAARSFAFQYSTAVVGTGEAGLDKKSRHAVLRPRGSLATGLMGRAASSFEHCR